MPLDYNQRINDLLKDNPYAAELGYGQEPAAPADPAEEPDFSHLLQPITATTPAPTGPDLDAPDFSHLLAPIEPAATPGYVGPTDQNYLQQGVNTATRRMTAGALNVAGGTMQGLARDPLGPVGWIPGLRGLADVAQPEQPIGWLQGAGQWAKDVAASPELAAPPGWAGGWTDTIASAVGSTLPFAATSLIPGGAAVSISSGAILGSYAALDEQVQEAIRNGATEEQIKKASRLASTGGLTEPVPLEIIFNRIPLPGLAKGAVQIAGRLLAKAAAEGGQEAVQTAIQNFSENYVYNPDQDLTEGLAQAFGIGAIVGTGFAVPAELAAGKAAPAPAPAPGVTPPAPSVTTPAGTPPPPAPGVAPGVTPPAPSVTTPPVIPTAPTGMPSVPSVIPPPAPIAADEDALPDLLPMPEEEPVVPEPVVAPVAELPAAPEQPLLPPEAPVAATPAAEQVELPFAGQPGAPTGPQVGGRPAAPSAKLPAAPRTPSQVQQATGVPYAEAARIAENEGWQAPSAPEQGDAEGVDVSHLLQPIGTRRTPAPPQFAGDRVNLKASDAQRQARNAEIGHYRWQPGINVGIEVPAAGTRRAMALPGARGAWEAQLPPGVAYGRIKGTRTRKPEIKTFIGSTPNDQVFLIDQIDPTTGKFDEPKVMLDFQSQEEARNAYISSYSDGRGAERIGSISAVPVADFRTWLKSSKTQRPFDRKATAASRRLRQAYTAEARQAEQQAKAVPDEGQVAPPAGPAPDTGEPDVAQAGVAPEQGEVQGAGQPEAEVQPQAGPVAAPDVGAFWDNLSIEARSEVAKAAGVRRSSRLSWEKIGKASQDKIMAFHKAMSPATAGPVEQPTPTDGGEDSQGLYKNARQVPQGGAVVRQVSGEGREDFQRQESGAPSDRAPQREEEQPAQQEGLAERWDKLPLEQKEAALKAAKVSRSPISRWKDLGEANQQKLRAAETPATTVSATAAPREERPQVTPEQQREVLAIVDKIAGDVRTEFKDTLETTAEGAAHYGQTEISPAATTETVWSKRDGRRLATLLSFALKGEGRFIIEHAHHEAWHAIERALGRANAKILKASLPKLRQRLEKDLGTEFAGQISEQEVLAYGFGLWGAKRYADVHIGLRKYYRAVREFLRRLRIALQPSAKTVEDIYREVARGTYRNAQQFKHQMFTPEGVLADIQASVGAEATTSAAVEPPQKTASILTRNAYGNRFHVMVEGQGIVFSGKTKRHVKDWMRRHGYIEAPPTKTTSATLNLGRRPIRMPSPGATFQMPEERTALGGRINLTAAERALIDRTEAAKRLDVGLAATGQAIPGDLSLWRAITLYESSTGERTQQILKRRVEPIIKGLRDIGETFERFDAYLYAQSALQENPRLRALGALSPDPSGMSDFDAQHIINNAHPEFANLAQHVYAMNSESLWQQYQAGLIDQATYNELATRSHYWVPHRGWEQGTGDDFAPTGQGFDLRGPAFRRRLGRFSKADSPLAWSMQAAHAGMVRSAKNRVGKVLHRLVRQFPNSAFWTVDKAEQESYEYEDPATGATSIRQRWVPPNQLARRAQGLKDTIVVWEQGKPHYITIHNAGLLTALRIMGAEESNTLLRGMGTALKTIGKLYTTWNPNFVIRNFFRDLETALINMGEEDIKGLRTGVLKTMPSATSAMWGYLRGNARPPGAVSHSVGQKPDKTEMLQYAHDFAMDGGKISWIETKSIEQQKRDLQKAINSKNYWHKAKVAKAYVLNGVEDINGSVENAVRLSLYVEMRKRGHSRAKAAAVAKEITVNFNTKGTLGQAINSMFLFFNARVQGNVRVMKAIRRSPKVRAAVLGLIGMGFFMDLINRWSGGDDDEGMNRWDNVPQWEKERNLIFMWNDTKWKMPLSFGYNFFYVAGQQMAAAVTNMSGMGQGVEPVDAAWNIMHAGINATSPIDIVREGYAGLAPTLVAPFIEMAENLNYQGAPIYPTKYDPKDPDAQLYFKSVPWFWKEVAAELEKYSKFDKRKPALIDVSPESLQHLANTYMGGAGQFMTEQLPMLPVNIYKLANAALTGKPSDVEARDIPLVREVYGKTDTSFAKQNTYYDVWDKVDQLHRTMTEEGVDSKEREAIKRRYPLEAAVYNKFKSVEKQLREQRARRKKIEANERLSGTEKQRRLDAVEEKMQDLRAGALAEYARKMKQRSGATLH